MFFRRAAFADIGERDKANCAWCARTPPLVRDGRIARINRRVVKSWLLESRVLA